MNNSISQPQLQRTLELISIVTPAYNEEKNLFCLYEKICVAMKTIGKNFELVVVENGSSDSSIKILRELRRKDGRVHYLSLTRNFGHQGALLAGLEHARGDVVISMDADLQHPPELIPDMVKLWEKGYDVVYTNKHDRKSQFVLRRIVNRFFYSIMRRLSGIELHGQSDFRLLDRKVVNVLCSLPERNKFLRGLTSWIGFRQTGIEYELALRHAGKSKFRLIHLIELAIDGIFSFSIIPLRIFTVVGLLISSGSFLYGVYLLLQKLYIIVAGGNGQIPPGWVTLVFVMLFFGGIQLIGIGLLGEYLGRVYDEVKRRPLYIIREDSFSKE